MEYQASVFRSLTEGVLRAAGLRPGLRVLDVGCGVGAVSFLAAELVGPSGEVVGIDGAAQPLEWAWRRARERGLSQVRFQHCDMASLPRERLFDAVVERRVLIHQRDPLLFISSGWLETLSRRVRRGLGRGGRVALPCADA
ncbi:SAM-dependent methyltransferase [Myxococcus fulvus]|uniref:SAM-dependent methyltransferase n=1 Tax=Myxococcus fulvus TaxID=33 RepID=UPI0020BE66BA|nr:class I SAM-dependent methyltransferase [Myxococcus fulvus]MCK8503879.1 class I SAM-dependent methyltransferase [Myxococcus fulvus]